MSIYTYAGATDHATTISNSSAPNQVSEYIENPNSHLGVIPHLREYGGE